MKYSDLNLSVSQEKVLVKVKDLTITVSKYLPLEDKIDLIEIALQKAEENGIYNEMKLAMYFDLYLIYMYTDLEFTEEEKADEYKLYNELQSNDIIVAVIGGIDEYENLVYYLNLTKQNKLKYKNSVIGLLQTFVQDMPRNAEAMSEIVNNFDKEKYKEVIEFARYANGGRPLDKTV